MEHEETGCQTPEAPILCVNNCGFFGSPATMNMCSKCHKDYVLNQEAKLAASSIDSIMNGTGSVSKQEPIVSGSVNASADSVQKTISTQLSVSNEIGEVKLQEGPSRCAACRKRVGLMRFNCRCGKTFCATHRYSDKHGCQFDYRSVAQDAIARANPVVKAEKLDKI